MERTQCESGAMTDPNDDSRPGYLLNRASRLFIRSREARLRELGVGPGQVPIVMALRDGAALSQKSLLEIVLVEQPTMAQTLARMERVGLVERERDPQDRRSTLIRLTATGRARIPEIVEVLEASNALALATFDEIEHRTLIALLRRIVANLESSDANRS